MVKYKLLMVHAKQTTTKKSTGLKFWLVGWLRNFKVLLHLMRSAPKLEEHSEPTPQVRGREAEERCSK